MVLQLFKPLYPNGPLVSPIGIGTYRMGSDHKDIIKYAIHKNMNLVDTSHHSLGGESEAILGEISQYIKSPMVIMTKLGLLTPEEVSVFQNTDSFTKVWEHPYLQGRNFGYTLSPERIKDHIMRSLGRLRRDYIDVCLLQNPEYYFQGLKWDRDLLSQVFEVLEDLIKLKIIGAYGISSTDYTNLKDCFSYIKPGFKIIQVPLNWLETDSLEVIAEAHAKNLGVVTYRPLDAFAGENLCRLVDPSIPIDTKNQQTYNQWYQLSVNLKEHAKETIPFPGYAEAPLSQIVLASLMKTKGVSSVLCGLRKISYVDDAVLACQLPQFPGFMKWINDLQSSIEVS